MKISGQVNVIVMPHLFVPGFLKGKVPPATTLGLPFPRITLAPAGQFSGQNKPGFFPDFSVRTHADALGRFSFNMDSSPLVPGTSVFISAYQEINMKVPLFGSISIKLYEPIYRSASFTLPKSNKTLAPIYLLFRPGTPADGISQDTLSAHLAALKKTNADLKQLSKLYAWIGDGHVGVRGSGKGADIKFSVVVQPDTSSNIDSFVYSYTKDLDIDLPGPDFLTGLCVDKGAIEKNIRNSVGSFATQVNSAMKTAVVDELAKQIKGVPKSAIQALFGSKVSITVQKLRYPVVKMVDTGISFFPKVETRSIVLDAVLGLPRNL